MGRPSPLRSTLYATSRCTSNGLPVHYISNTHRGNRPITHLLPHQFCFRYYWDFLRGETRVHIQKLCRQRENTLLLELSLHRGITNAFISPSQWCAQCGGHRNSYLNRIIDESRMATQVPVNILFCNHKNIAVCFFVFFWSIGFRFGLVLSNRTRLGAVYCKRHRC